MPVKILLVPFVVFFAFVTSCNPEDERSANTLLELSETDRKEIIDTFMATQKAWNEGDLQAFMEAYWKSDDVAFVGATGPVYGYKSTLQRYQRSYPDQEAMGKLKFDILRLNKIDQYTALLIGKYYLTRSIEDLEGYYTLVWKKIDGKWVIISDHSSGQEVEE